MLKSEEKGKNGSANNRPSEDLIALRAYYIYLNRGAGDGHDVEDWLTAERQLMAKPKAKPLAAAPR